MFHVLFFSLIQFTLLALTAQSQLQDILSDTDKFFNRLKPGSLNKVQKETENFKNLVRRSYGIVDGVEHSIGKRSLKGKTSLYRDKKGVFIISDIKDSGTIPAKFPNDIEMLSLPNGAMLIAALESNLDSPQSKLANHLVLYRFRADGLAEEMARTETAGGFKLASFSYQNVTYLLASEYEAESNHPFKGSSLYGIFTYGEIFTFEKIQILNITHPRDLKFWQHQEQVYLAVAAGQKDGNGKSYTLIYKWLGHNFDFIQKIEGHHIQCVTPFIIGSTMFLAVANQKAINGDTDINSEIFRFHLQNEKFIPYQKIRTHAASDISHFSFRDSELQMEDHFLVVANYYEEGSGGARNYRTDSVMYKFQGEYFVPFQSFKLYGVLQWVPVKGLHDEFLLLAVSSHTAKAFQYDGWRFTEVELNYGQSPFGENIMSMRSFIYNEEIYLTAADKTSHGAATNIWKVKFKKENFLEKFYEDIENWCQDVKFQVESENLDSKIDELNSRLYGASKTESSDRFIKLNHAKIDTLETQSFGILDGTLVDNVNNLNARVENLKGSLSQLKDTIEKVDLAVYYEITDISDIPYLELNCCDEGCCSFENLNIGNLNGVDFVHFLNNAVLINEDLFEHNLEFEDVRLIHDVSPSHLNGHPAESVLDTESIQLINSEIIVNGTVIIQGDLKIQDYNIEYFKSEGSFLFDGPENNTGELVADSVFVTNLEIAGKLNGIEIESLMQNPYLEMNDTYDSLTIHDLRINGTLLGISDDYLDADQNEDRANVTMDFDVLEVEELIIDSNTISDVPLSDIVQISEGKHYKIQGGLNFTQPTLEVNYLEVTKSINGDPIDNDSNAGTEELSSDIITVKGTAYVEDILHPTENYSLLDIIQHGILLNETVINATLEFDELKIDEASIASINDVPTDSWILKNSSHTQIIRGLKQFSSDVHIKDNVTVSHINGIDLEELYNDTMFLDTDETISRNMSFSEIIATEIISNITIVGDGKLVFEQNRIKINDNIELDTLSAQNVTVSGLIDGLSWNDMFRDSVFEKNDLITGEKFINGQVEARNVNVSGTVNSIPPNTFPKNDLEEEEEDDDGEEEDPIEIVFHQDIVLNYPLKVVDFVFEGTLDTVESSRFGKEWLLSEGDQTITAPVTFTDVKLSSAAVLRNETVNGINLRNMFGNSIKINENVDIQHMVASEDITAEDVDLRGTLNGADFQDAVVLKESDTPQTVNGQWFISGDLIITGSLIVEGLISGVNASHLCHKHRTEPDSVNLIVGGSVTFDVEPEIKGNVNGVNLEDLMKRVWFKNENVTLSGPVEFCDVEMHDSVRLRGKLNGVDLEHLSRNYFSKSRTKIVPQNVTVRNLIVKNSCRIRNLTVGGSVNGVDLVKWSRSVLLQDEDQVVTARHHFSEFSTGNLVLNGTVNGVDLVNGVLRYDVEGAVVTGQKTFFDLVVENMTLAEGKTIQGVSVDEWARNAVTKDGNFTIRGDLTLHDSVLLGGLRALGTVNGLIFDRDHILTTTGNQVVSGRKTFDLKNYPNRTMKVNELVAHGPISGIDLNEMIEEQAYKDRDLVFSQPKTFLDGMSADHLTVTELVQGVNVSQLCDDVSRPIEMSDLSDKYKELIEEAKFINSYLKERPFFLDHYEEVQMLKNVFAVLPFTSSGADSISVIKATEIRVMEWDFYSEKFVFTDDLLKLKVNVTFATSGVSNDGLFLYIGTANHSIINIQGVLSQIPVPDPSCVAPFELKSLNLSCFIMGQKSNGSNIYCYTSDTKQPQIFQNLDKPATVEASALNVHDDVYIAAINRVPMLGRMENHLTVYKFNRESQRFGPIGVLPLINPVGVSTIDYRNFHYFLALAGGHLPGSIDTSIVTIFRLNRETGVFTRYQSIAVDTPVDVHFALLPTSELVLYVLSLNQAKPFIVYMYKGIRGFAEETSGLSLYVGHKIHSFTDSRQDHFVFISGGQYSQILKAGFKGNKRPLSMRG